MKLEILASLVVISLTCNVFGNAMSVSYTDEDIVSTQEVVNMVGNTDVNVVHVAVLSIAELYESDTHNFIDILEGHQWKVGNRSYKFVTTVIFDEDILRGTLITENFDVLVIPGIIGTFEISKHWLPNLKNKVWKKKISDFVKEGGGFYGSCSGASIAGDMENKPEAFSERMMKNSCLGISAANIQFHMGLPIISQIRGYNPGALGISAYVMTYGFNRNNYSVRNHNGVCPDVSINKGNPIFDDYIEATRKIRWTGGAAYVVPENPDRDITVLARFPEEEMSDNITTQIHYWNYTGGIRGITKAIKSTKQEIYYYKKMNIFMKLLVFASDWEHTEKLVKTNYSCKPFITAEIYPNENKARIVRCTGVPDYNVWWGGRIEEASDTDNNNLFDGLNHWVDVIHEQETVEDEIRYNYWIIRRVIAWVSKKVHDNDLPPVYGSSQVSDIYPYEQTSSFTIEGNAKTENGIMLLDLYYRYSDDNESWSDWTLYDTDVDDSDGWSWEFNALELPAYYQFYSRRHVRYEHEWMNETAPPGPDAAVRIKID